MSDEVAIKIPDLTRLRKAKGTVNDEFRIKDFIYKFSRCYVGLRFPEMIKQYEKLPVAGEPSWYKYFCSYFDPEDAIFRRDMLGVLLDDVKAKDEFWAICENIPTSEQIDRILAKWKEYGGGWEDHEDVIYLKKAIEFPSTLERICALPGTGEGINELRGFAQHARTLLSDYARICATMHPESLGNKDAIGNSNLRLAREYRPQTLPFMDLIKRIAEIKDQLEHYAMISLIYEITPNIGERAPICKPEFLDPGLRQATITDAHHPIYNEYCYDGCGYICRKLDVPNDIHWGDDARHSFVRGPHSRGKSVYLDNIGFNVHLVNAGLYCFATSCQMSPVQTVHACADTGDSENAGHFETWANKINYMLDNLGKDDIVLLDEATGTEPEAEIAIVRGLTDALIAHDITSFIVSHDKGVWRNYEGRLGIRMLRSADYDDKQRKFKIWEGEIEDGYGLRFAEVLGIDPNSVMQKLDERLK